MRETGAEERKVDMKGTEHAGVASVHGWWQRLVLGEGGGSQGGRRAAVARLRRAQSPLEVMMEPEALRLISRFRPERAGHVAVLAGVLAFVQKDAAKPIIRTVGRQRLDDENSAKLSEVRFRRLLQFSTDELLYPMRRLIRLTRGEADVGHLARSILYWGDSMKKKWIFDYYGVWLQDEERQTA